MRTFIAFIFALIIGNSQAQTLKVSLGELLPAKRGSSMLDAGLVGDKIFIIESEGWNINLKFYSPSTLKLTSSKIIRQKSCPKNSKDCVDNDFGYEKTIFLKDGLIMLFSSYEKKSKEYMLFAQKIDAKGNFDGKLTVIDKIESKNRRNTGSYLTWQSKDSTKFLIIQNPPYEKYAGEKFVFKVYDTELKNLSNFSIALPYKDKDVSVSDYYLGNDGTIYMLVNVVKEKSEKEKGQDLSFYSILSLKGKDGDLSEYDLKLADKDIETVALRLDEKNSKVICSGLYSDISKGYTGKKIDGLFYLNVDMTKKEIISKGFKSIDNSVLAAILNVSEEKIDKKASAAAASKNFEIMDIIPLSDGSTRLITEYRQVVVVTTRTCDGKGNCTTTYTYHYYRKNIFVVTIDKDGNILSFTDIPKKQHTINDLGKYSSFLLFEKDDRTFFLFNDNPENLAVNAKSIKDMKEMYKISKSCLVAVELNKDGSFTKKKVYDVAEKGIALMPESGIEIAKGQYVVPIQQVPKGFTCACLTLFSKDHTGIAKISL
jgi:hypothetical protein